MQGAVASRGHGRLAAAGRRHLDCDNEMKEPRLVLARLPGSFQLRCLLRLLPADLEETCVGTLKMAPIT
jgi:hypothetical protein